MENPSRAAAGSRTLWICAMLFSRCPRSSVSRSCCISVQLTSLLLEFTKWIGHRHHQFWLPCFMAASCSSMACLPCSNLNSAPLPAAIPRPRLHCSLRTPTFRIPASPSFLQLRCACVRVQAFRSDLGEVGQGKKERPFVYNRAKPEVRWPHRSDELHQQRIARELENAGRVPSRLVPDWEELSRSDASVGVAEEGDRYVVTEAQTALNRRLEREEGIRKREALRQQQKGQVRRLQSMSKLALRKVTDLKNRARRLSTAICKLGLARPVADVLDDWPEQLNNDELSVVVRNVGDQNWKRALELYEWLNLRKWYTPNPRLLATILHILARVNQVEAARDLFFKAEPELTSCIQVFNAILGVYAKHGEWQAAQHILELMALRGCEPDITTFNTIANARCKDDLQPGMASALLNEIERAGLRPDITTYNTLLGGCITNNNVTEATEIVKQMEQRGFDLDSCTSYVLGKDYLKSDEGEKSILSALDETSQQHAPSNILVQSILDDDMVQQAGLREVGESSSDFHSLQRGTEETSEFNLPGE